MRNLLLHLSLIDQVGPAALNRIIKNLSAQQMCQLYSFTAADFVALCGFSDPLAAKIAAGLADKKMLERELQLLQKNKIIFYTCFDPEYPSLLQHIYFPPIVLYLQGTLTDHQSLAVVGSRKTNPYAQRAVDLLIPPLVEQGWTIVSGGALGVDTFAHQATLKAGGKTVVVLGSGLLCRYPSENNKLFDVVVATGGALISPFALTHQPLQGNFPARNRIIAGISRGCLVVQAAQKSGARITATYALEQGKEVFVVPGPIDDAFNGGGHALVQQGAKLVTSAQDIVSEFHETFSVGSRVQLPSSATAVEPAVVDPLVTLCKNPISLEDLAILSGLSLFEIQSKMFDLQLEGHVAQNFAGLWQASL
jgi:DNA processing protein